MAYDISTISLKVDLGSTKDVEAKFNALVKTLEAKKIKLEVDTSSIQASLNLASGEIEKAYQQQLASKQKHEDAKLKITQQSNAQAMAYLKQQQAEIQKTYGVNSKLTFNQNPDTKQITSAMISFTNEVGKAETRMYKLNENIATLASSGEKIKSIKLEPVNEKITDDIVKVNNELNKAQKSLESFKFSMGNKISNVNVGSNSDVANQLVVFEQLKTKFRELQNFKLTTTNINEYITRVKELNNLYSQTQIQIKSVNSANAEMSRSANLDSNATNKIKDFNAQLDIMLLRNRELANNPAFTQLRQDVEKLKTTPLTQFDNAAKDITRNMKLLRAETTSSIGVFNKLGQSIKSAFSFMSLTMIMYQFSSAVRDIPNLVRNVDTSLVELNKVANLSESQLNSFLETAYKVGEGLGRTGSQVTDATTEFVKAGYDLAESTKLAESAMLSMNVGSGMNDIELATNSLIATLKGFEMEATSSKNVVDTMAKVADTTAIGYSELANGIERVSAVMNQGDTSFSQTLGLLTSTYELSRNIEKSATGINTISQRMRGLKIGDSGELEKDSELIGKVEEKLKSIAGVELMGDDGQLRSTFDVLQDLSKVYGTLTTNQKQYLTEVLAGNRQNTVLSQIMQNWDAVDKSIQAATTSAGYSEEVNVRFLDSINGRIASLKSAWEQLATTTLSSDTIKTFVSGLTKIVEFADAIGGLVPVLASVVISMTALKVISASQSLTFGGLIQGAKSLVTSLFTVKTATDAATVSTLALSAAEKTLVVGAIVAGVMAIGAGIHYVATSSERAARKVSDLVGELSQIKDSSKTLKGLADEFEKLSDKGELNSEESKRFYEVQNQIKELQPEISGYYDEQGNFIITQVSSAQELLDIQKEILEAKKEELKNAQEDVLDDNIKKYEKKKEILEEIAKQEKYINDKAANGDRLTNYDVESNNAFNRQLDAQGGKDKVVSDAKKEMAEAANEIHEYLINSLTLDDAWDSLGESMKNGIRKTLSEMDAEEINDFSSKIKDGSLSISDFIGEMSRISTPVENVAASLDTVSEESSETGESVKSLSERASESANKLDILKVALGELESTQDISGTTLDKLIKKYPELEDKLTDTSTAFDVINGKILEQSFDSATDDIASLTSVLEDLQAGNGLTAASFKKISDNFPELLAYMNDEASLTDAISEKMDELKDTQNDAYRQMLLNSQDYYNANIRGNEQMSNSILSNVQGLFKNLGLAYNGDLQNWKSLAQGKAEIETQLINQLNTAWESHFGNLRTSFTKLSSNSIVEKGTFDRESYAKKNLLTDSAFSTDKTILDMAEKAFYNQESEWIKEKAKMQQEMYNVSKLFDDITFDPIDIKVGGTKSSSGSKSSEKYTEYIDSIYDSILNSLQEGTDKVDRQIAISQSKLENLELFGTQEDVTNATADLEKLYQDRIDIMKKSSGDMVSLRNKMAKELQATGYDEIKGLDLANISQLGVDKIISKLEQQITSANNSDNAKLAASLTYKKNLIEDYTGNIINANSEINSMSKDIIDAQNELADTVIDNINRVLDNTISKANSTLGQIDLEKMLLDTSGNSDAAKADAQKLVELNKQALTEIVTQRKATEDAINKLRAQGIKDESDEIQTLLDQWRGYESSRLTMIKEMAEARKQASIDSEQDELDGTQDALDDGKNLLDLTVNMLKKETEAKKDALKEQTDDRKDALEEQYDAEEKALKDKLDLLKKEANAQKDALKDEQDERNYNDEVSEKQKQISNVQSKITELSLDDSVSAQKKRKTLEEELAKYKKELEDLQYDRSIELQTNAIDKELENQEDKINKELEALKDQYDEEVDLIEKKYDKQIKEYEDYLSKESKLRQQANDLIASKDKAFYEKLKAYATEYSGMVSSEFTSLWDNAYSGMEKYGNGQMDVISNIESMTERIISLRKEIEELNNTSYKNFIDDDPSTSDDDYSVSNGSSSSGSSSSSGGKYDGLDSKSEREEYRDKQLEKLISYGDQMKGLTDTNAIKKLKDKQAEVAQTIGAYLQNGTYYIMINGKKYPVRNAIGVRHQGGFMDEASVKLKSNEMFGKLLKNEFVVNEGQMDNFMTKTLPSIAGYNSGGSSSVSVVLDMHDFSITQDNLPDFKEMIKTEVPKVLNDTLYKKAIR